MCGSETIIMVSRKCQFQEKLVVLQMEKVLVTPCSPQSVKITILAKNYGKLKDVNV
jgi:GTP cyclohydrolase I